MYYVYSYQLKENKASAYQEWLKSEEALGLFKEIEAETKFKYINTYWPIMGFGTFDCEDWWEIPDWSAFDKIRASASLERFFEVINDQDFIDSNRSQEAKLLRSNVDVKIHE